MIIHVTQKHIDEGIKGSNTKCPVALALREYFPNALVAPRIYINPTELPILYIDILAVMAFTAHFDVGNTVKPFEFEIPWEPVHQ